MLRQRISAIPQHLKLSGQCKKWYPVEIIRVNLNPDDVPDYFIIDHSGISTGIFFNGKDSSEITTDSVHAPWSRPGIEMEYRIIDVNCGDHQQELLVCGGGGGTAGLYHLQHLPL
ncbi:MAG: hypothetical protein IPP72_12940 [Chitinophagaceae bacterium]|nr:hypothetical protein [Chitinophagaceae bacterium]